MQNYAKMIPKDRSDAPMQEYAVPYPALKVTVTDNGSASSVTALSSVTTVIEVAAVNSGAGIKWTTAGSQGTSVITAAGTANFDNFIPAGVVRRFVVPRNTQSLSNASISGINVQEGLYSAVAIKGGGVGSVLLTEY